VPKLRVVSLSLTFAGRVFDVVETVVAHLDLFIRQQTSVINAIRAHLAEFGIVGPPVGRQGVEQMLGVAADSNDKRLPEVARTCVAALGAQLRTLKAQILQVDRVRGTFILEVQRWTPRFFDRALSQKARPLGSRVERDGARGYHWIIGASEYLGRWSPCAVRLGSKTFLMHGAEQSRASEGASI
jgi:hypothetical protein